MTFRILASYAYFRTFDMAQLIAEMRAAYQGPVEIFADSGAFSAATLGTTLKMSDYAAWLRDWRTCITTAATFDVIGDHVATAKNTDALLSAGLDVLPTFHVGTPWPVLDSLCKKHPYLALGGMVPHSNNPKGVMRWLVRAFRIAQEHGTVYHGFGQTTHTTNAALPFYSVDSSSWGAAARYGSLSAWDERRKRLTKITMGNPAEAHAHSHLLRAHGLNPAVVGRRGFCQRAHRDKPQYDLERTWAVGGTAEAWRHYERWLQQRHQVAAPPGRTPTGTILYLADTDVINFRLAAQHLGTRKAALT